MKRYLLMTLLLMTAGFTYSQTTYYWVGGAGPTGFSTNANWNTALDGSGTTRATVSTSDILIFNGSNIGGAVPATGTVTATMTSTTADQVKFVSNASVVFTRISGGTGTLTIAGGSAGDDMFIESGSSLSLNSATADGSVQMVFGTGVLGKVN